MPSRTRRAGALALCAALFMVFGTAACGKGSTYSLYGSYVSRAFFPDRSPTYTPELIASVPFATIGLAAGPTRMIPVALDTIRNGEHVWLTDDPYAIVTRGGRIIRTAGFDRNLSITREAGADPVAEGGLHRIQETVETRRLIDFNDDLVFGIEAKCRLIPKDEDVISILELDHLVRVVKERCYAPRVHWRFTNRHWVDLQTGRVWRTHQHFHPLMPPLTIEVLRPSIVPPGEPTRQVVENHAK